VEDALRERGGDGRNERSGAVEARPGLPQILVQIGAAVDLDLEGVDIVARRAVAGDDMAAGIGTVAARREAEAGGGASMDLAVYGRRSPGSASR